MINAHDNCASALRAARASLDVALDHFDRAAQAETFPGQRDVRLNTAAQEAQACVAHTTMALYWMFFGRLGA